MDAKEVEHIKKRVEWFIFYDEIVQTFLYTTIATLCDTQMGEKII